MNPPMADDRFMELFDQSPEPAYVIDPIADRILAANAAGCAMLGFTHKDLLRTPVSQIHPAERSQMSDFLERVVADGQASTIKLTCRTKIGTFLPTEMSLHAFQHGGRLRVLGLVQDRSEHRHRDPVA
jgi:PAS domain S-box-containing protein